MSHRRHSPLSCCAAALGALALLAPVALAQPAPPAQSGTAQPSRPRAPESKSVESKPAERELAASKPPPARRHAGAEQGPRPGLADAVVLRDGSVLRGTLLRVEPGNYVLLLGIEGVRTIPWRGVERVESAAEANSAALASEPPVQLLAPCCADEAPASTRRAPEEAWADISLGWDLRAEGVALFKRYSAAERAVWHGGEGYGAGASLSLHFRGPAWLGAGAAARWAELELGASNSFHSVSWREGAAFETDFMQNQSSLIAGAHFASGRWSQAGKPSWSGLVLGVAWLPTYVRFFGSKDFASTGAFHPAGLRLTADWGRVSPGRKGRMPGVRAFITWLPYVGHLPTAVSFGLGAVFY